MKTLGLVASVAFLALSLSCGGPAKSDKSELDSLVGDLTITTNRDCKRFAGASNPNNYCMGPVFRAGFGGPHGVLWELNGFSEEDRTRIKLGLDYLTKQLSDMNRHLYNNKDGAVPRHPILNCTEKYADRDFQPIDADTQYVWRTQIRNETEQVTFGSLALVRMLENHAKYAVPVRIEAFFEDADDKGVTLGYTDRNTINFRQTTPGYLWLNTFLTGSKITVAETNFYFYSPEAIANVIAHELLHRVGYMHGKGNNAADYPTTFIYEFGECVERGGSDRGGALLLANGKQRPALKCTEPKTKLNPISMPTTPPVSGQMTPEIANAETILKPGPTRFEWDDANKACIQQPDSKKVSNSSCGQAERQIKMQGSECLVFINGDYRFTLRPGQDECPAMSAGSRSLDDGLYQVSARHSNKCLEVKDGSMDDGASLRQASCNGSSKQKFRLTYLNQGLYYLQPNGSSKCVDAKNSSFDNGTPVVQTECNFAQSQYLLLNWSTNDSYTLQFSHSQKCVTVPGGSQEQGKTLQQSDCTGAAEQDFLFTKDGAISSNGDMCQYKHKKDTAGGKSGQVSGLDAFGKTKTCDKNGDWKNSCKDGNGDTDEVGCGLPAAEFMCQYKHKKDTKGGKSGQVNGLDAFGKTKSCNKNGDWKTSCKDGNGDTDEVACQ